MQRIMSLDKGAFPSLVDWAFAVVGAVCRDLTSVQRSFRSIMRNLHPDKVNQSPAVLQALEQVREAKKCCERSLLKQQPPGVPRIRCIQLLSLAPGRRRIKLEWSSPDPREDAPVEKYIVSVVDTRTGRAERVIDLEPDYCEELGRYVSIDELRSYTLVEEDLQLLHMFKQTGLTLCVAAANRAGQSSRAKAYIPLCTQPIMAVPLQPLPIWKPAC